jgi:hypothetical protein
MIFEPFPKLARLSRGCVVTEKLDGTNAQVYIVDPETLEGEAYEDVMQTEPVMVVGNLSIYAGSRTRTITPGKPTDNYGFAQWVQDNALDLVKLGEGRHFGEWYGQGIQRGYALKEKRFALFNTERWQDGRQPRPSCCDVVPVLHAGAFETIAIEDALEDLRVLGSKAVPGFMDPEGIVVYHAASRASFKKTFDDRHKEAA